MAVNGRPNSVGAALTKVGQASLAGRVPLALVALVLLAFSGSYTSGTLFEDERLLASGAGLKSLADAFAHNSLGLVSDAGKASFWRPLATLAYAGAAQLGLSIIGVHIMCAVLHGLTACLVYRALQRWGVAFGNAAVPSWLAFSAALFWAVAPLRAESVAWISGLCDVLGAACLLLVCEGLSRAKTILARIILAGLGTAVCLLAKEALVIAPLFVAIEATRSAKLGRWLHSPPFLASATAVVLFLAYRLSTGGFGGKGQIYFSNQSFAVRTGMVFETLGYAAKDLLCPFWATLFPGVYLFDEQLRVESSPIVGLFGLLFVLSLGFLWWKARAFRVPVLMMFGGILPVLNLIPTGMESRFSDRYTYVPQLGVVLGLVLLCQRLLPRAQAVVQLVWLGGTTIAFLLCGYRAHLFGHPRELLDFELAFGSRPRVVMHEAAFLAMDAGDFPRARDLRLSAMERAKEVGIGSPLFAYFQALRWDYEAVGEARPELVKGFRAFLGCGLIGGQHEVVIPWSFGERSSFPCSAPLVDLGARETGLFGATLLLVRARAGEARVEELDRAYEVCRDCSVWNLELGFAYVALGESEKARKLSEGEFTLRFQELRRIADYQERVRRMPATPEREAAIQFLGLAPKVSCGLLRGASSASVEHVRFRELVCELGGTPDTHSSERRFSADEVLGFRNNLGARYDEVRTLFPALPKE